MGDVAKGIKSFKKGMATDVIDETQDATDETHQKNISDDNQDSTNQDSTNQDSNNKE
jgi:sec-independent protein translocase protein TatA